MVCYLSQYGEVVACVTIQMSDPLVCVVLDVVLFYTLDEMSNRVTTHLSRNAHWSSNEMKMKITSAATVSFLQ